MNPSPPLRTRLPARLRLCVCTGLWLALGGCAVGRVGTLAAQVHRDGDVTTVVVYSAGLHLRTSTDDLGAHLGLSRRTSVYAEDAATRTGWHLFVAPASSQPAVAQDLVCLGIDLSVQPPAPGLTLGYNRTRLHARLPADASVFIGYAGADRRVALIKHCSETTPCKLTTRAP